MEVGPSFRHLPEYVHECFIIVFERTNYSRDNQTIFVKNVRGGYSLKCKCGAYASPFIKIDRKGIAGGCDKFLDRVLFF